jgi:hypothetical protein
MIKAAGCVFTDGKLILAGYQKHKKTPMITGIGGKLEEREDPIQGAWRETLEELFEWDTIPEEILMFCIDIPPKESFTQNQYIQFIYDFKVLERVLQECYIKGIQTKVYDKFPFTLQELFFDRDPKGEHVEIDQLVLLPMESQMIARHFLRDIGMIRGDDRQDRCLIVNSDSEEES